MLERPRITIGLLLLLLAPTARAQDEPGVDEPRPAPPVLPRPGPEPVPAPGPSSAPAPGSALESARRDCRPGMPCPHLPALIASLLGVGSPEAVALLGGLGDPRAVLPLLLVRAHGESSPLREAARVALRRLCATREARGAALRIAQSDPDPALRRAAAEALTGDPTIRIAPPTLPSAPARTEESDDPDRTRVVYGPTAIPRQKRRFAWTIFNVGYWNFDYGLTRNVELGMHTVPPIGVLAFLPHIKIGGRLSEHVHLGVQLTGGVLYPYIENDGGWHVGVYGGGPILTIEAGRFQVNLAAPFYGATIVDNHRSYSYGMGSVEETRRESHWVATPNLGFSARVGRHVRLNLEAYAILGDHELNGEVWGVLYGVRFFGERIFGDVSFVIPIFPGVDEILQYIPTGVPLLTFGVLF